MEVSIMIQMQSILDVADNSGAKKVMCIKVLGGSARMISGCGDVIVVSINIKNGRGKTLLGHYKKIAWEIEFPWRVLVCWDMAY